jgi:2-oxoglutarate dehydrogenase E1 component
MGEEVHEPNSLSLVFVEQLYEDYLRDASAVPAEWQAYFKRVAQGNGFDTLPRPERSTFSRERPETLTPGVGTRCAVCGRGEELATLQHLVDKLIRNYRVRGHRIAQVDPLGPPRFDLPELTLSYYGLNEAHLDLDFTVSYLDSSGVLSLRSIIDRLRNTYCRSIGVQFMHIDDIGVREWLQSRIEGTQNRLQMSRDRQLRILTRLTDAVIFEQFIQRKYVGAKRFSLEGAESLIPLLDLAIDHAGEQGIKEIVIGMAHRGRLNVLANIMGKNPRDIFREFEDVDAERLTGRGDVKYHLGFHNDWTTSSGHEIHLALCFNPSHLEFVNPVALGRVRAKQDRLGDVERAEGMVLLVHGDAAFVGEGVVQESLNLSELAAYTTGGALHVIVNNQIGFTATPEEGRSSVYASDVAKMLQVPIFHVNGEDPEAVAQVIQLAMDYRKTFKRDVVIDMYCYRRHGHNETDEPSFTNPILYRAIQNRQSVRDGYLQHLLTLGEVTSEEADEIAERRREQLARALDSAHAPEPPKKSSRPSILGRLWRRYEGGFDKDVPEVDTRVPVERLSGLLERLAATPGDFRVHPKLERWLRARREMAAGKRPLDWAAAEALALATLAADGARVRMSGQDCARGTFSHRHAILYDSEDGHPYVPLQNVSDEQAPVEFFNSPLSEVGVMGFEYGYSIAYPDGLIMWEAQFGDFANVAQVIIDQGIASAEDKWGSLCGLVLLLPHGFEGMGPEHSSARLERFLTLAAEDNIQIVNCTTPAQYFHCMRRQVVRPWRKPLVVMTPKSLLRYPKAVSSLDDLAEGGFHRILPDAEGITGNVRRVLMCSGKVYYDLLEAREKIGCKDIAILRVEQLYPLQENYIQEALSPYSETVPVVWVQEEPENMGAWLHLRSRFCERLLGKWRMTGVYRAGSASPATGSAGAHKLEQREIVEKAFAP